MVEVYKLRCTLSGHKSDVRAVTCLSDTRIVSASRDLTARTWHISKEGCDGCEDMVLLGHTNYVSAVCCQDLDNECHILTGSHDKLIRGYNSMSPEALFTLEGHKDTVCTLAVGNHKTIISGSWDKSIKIWKEGKCVSTLTGHEAAVWCVLVMSAVNITGHIDDLIVISGSADQTIRIWCLRGLNQDISSPDIILLNSLNEHKDCVRALARIDDSRFLSASNDASIRAWDATTGKCIGEFYGHTNFVYGLACSPDFPKFVSCGEDRSIRVWLLPSASEWAPEKHFSCFQTILLPCQSAWCVAMVPNGDIIVGGSDSMIRIFSCDSTRQASSDILKLYETELANFKITVPSSSGAGDLVLNNLPGVEALTRPGKSEGQIMVINDNGRSVCYQWSSHGTRWIEVGDVVGSQPSNRQVHEGKEYDFVFTVDIDDSMPGLKLPYNRTEDPWFAAHSFIQRHDLPAGYLDTVANFIIQNAGPPINPVVSNDLSHSDPFTGAHRYIPSNFSSTITKSTTNGTSVFTSHFPPNTFISMKSISLGPLMTKLESFNVQSPIPLNNEFLEACRKFNIDDCTETEAVHLTTHILDAINKWTPDTIFPLLDILRCLVFWPISSDIIFETTNWNYLLLISFNNPDLSSANCLLMLRLLVNSLAADGPRFIDTIQRQSLSSSSSSSLTNSSDKPNVVPKSLITAVGITGRLVELVNDNKLQFVTRKPHQVALACLMYNMSVLVHLAKPFSIESNIFPQLRFIFGVCIRISLNILSLALDHGCSGVTQLHPEAVNHLFVSIGTCLLSVTSGLNSTDEQLKTQRIRILASAMIGLKDLPQSVDNDVNIDNNVEEFTAWESVRKIINYWITTPTVCSNVRACASQLLSILE
ncbi:unnamed protein product [Schistosoma haematobium]|nr:unnamed protein product [Schistosoma haematobium]